MDDLWKGFVDGRVVWAACATKSLVRGSCSRISSITSHILQRLRVASSHSNIVFSSAFTTGNMTDRQENVVKHDYSLLKPEDEDALHKSRLLPIEQRPFQRLTKRLLSSDSLLLKRPTLHQLPTPPAETAPDDTAPSESGKETQTETEELYSQFREDMLLDFALFDSTMVRIQLLRNSNEKERARYATEKSKIMETSDSVRLNITQLRQELEEEQRKLALRKQYDELTEKITSNRMLRPREDQEAQLEKLEKEIAQLGKRLLQGDFK